ncbi:MAG: hypothetical protein WD969_06580 [Paracoccaceae bacterium]
MAEFILSARSAFGGAPARVEAPGVTFDEAGPRGLVHLAARRGLGAALEAEIAGLLPLPGAGRSAEADGFCAVALAPGQWLITGPQEGLETHIAMLAASGAVTDLSDAYVSFRLEGPGARAVLARLSSLDFEETAFPVGAAARTIMAHIGVIIRRLPDADGPAYALETARSTARSFAHDVAQAIRAMAASGR